MPAAVHLALLGLAVASLWSASLRAAARIGAEGLERLIAAAVLAATVVVLETLGLSLLGLGGSTVALVLAALATWALSRLLPAPSPVGLATPGRRARIALACLVGTGLAWTVWLLVEPQIGFDSSHYHWVEVVIWVDSGRPGSSVKVSPDIPYESYPLTNEIVLAWLAGIGRSFVPLVLWSPVMFLLLAISVWTSLRRLRVDPSLAAAALVALCSVPFLVRQLADSGTDLPALAWTAAAAALCAASLRTPGLLPVAVLAAALAVGTKTTPVVPLAAALGLALFASRHRLRRLRAPLALALAAGVAVGGTWYLRNLFEHGSPLWPFVELPGSDPPPRIIGLVDHSFLERPRATLNGNLAGYAERLAGALLVIPAALAAPILVRERRVVVASTVALASTIAWAAAPVTGLGDPDLAFVEGYALSASRYLLPAIGVCALAVALAGARAGRPRAAALALLWTAIALNVGGNVALNGEPLPPLWVLAAGAALAGAAAALAALLPSLPKLSTPAWAAVAAACGLLLAPAASGFVDRHADAAGTPILGRAALHWLRGQESFRSGDRPVLVGRYAVAGLAGDRFEHELRPIGLHESCRSLRRRAAGGWIVVTDLRLASGLEPLRAMRCLRDRRPGFEAGGYSVYPSG